MKEEKVSNYIKLCDEWAEKFLRMDKMELMKKLPELKQEDGYLKIVHFGVPFGVRESDGKIERLDGKTEANATEMLRGHRAVSSTGRQRNLCCFTDDI